MEQPRKKGKRAPCPVCQTTTFRKRDGALYCTLGHQIHGYYEDAADDDTMMQGGLRLLKRGRKQQGRALHRRKTAVVVVYGAEGKMLAFEAFGHMLLSMALALVTRYGAGDEFVSICCDIWLLYVEANPPEMPRPASPIVSTTAPTAIANGPLSSHTTVNLADVTDSEDEGDSDADNNDRLGYTLDPNDADTELADNEHIGRGKSSASSSTAGVRRRRQRTRSERTTASVASGSSSIATLTLPMAPAILYLACTMLRIPMLVADIHRMCMANDIPYLTAFDSLPRRLQKALMSRFHHSLQPWYMPGTRRLRTHVTDLAHLLSDHYGIAIPSPPAACIFYRWTLEWRLPLPFFTAATAILGTLAPPPPTSSGSDNSTLQWARAQPLLRDPRALDPRESPRNPELVMAAVAVLAARAVSSRQRSSSTVPPEQGEDVSVPNPYALSRHNPPATYPALMAWAASHPHAFLAWTRAAVPEYGASLTPTTTRQLAPSDLPPERKPPPAADIAAFLDQILADNSEAAAAVPDDSNPWSGFMFPNGAPPVEGRTDAVLGRPLALHAIEALARGAVRCEAADLELVLGWVAARLVRSSSL
ncbi:hypothetical protein BC828DRAFT_403481 [Blastocladiella britannica]|nr:hypothetical protein BC828DRAFT_403481 [Blastocladiella britannica]